MDVGATPLPSVGSNPDPEVEQEEREFFPNLGGFKVTDRKTLQYNCIAWSVGITDRWIWTEVDSVYGDKDGQVSVSDFDRFYAAFGYTISDDCQPEYQKRKIALFVNEAGEPEHAAREMHDGGWWESKKGGLERIVHQLEDMRGRTYGTVFRCYEIVDTSANLGLGQAEDYTTVPREGVNYE
jgi:hypothetical protein